MPEPADVSYDAGNIGLFGSLQSETLNFKKLTVKHGGKTLRVPGVDRLLEGRAAVHDRLHGDRIQHRLADPRHGHGQGLGEVLSGCVLRSRSRARVSGRRSRPGTQSLNESNRQSGGAMTASSRVLGNWGIQIPKQRSERMRRKLVVTTALLCLFGGRRRVCGRAREQPHRTATPANFAVAGALGQPAKPVPVALAETLGMSSTTSGNVGAPLVNIKTTTYGVKAPNGAYFPMCTAATDQRRTTGTTASGTPSAPRARWSRPASVTAALTSPSANLAGPGAPCSLGSVGLQRRCGQADVLLHDHAAPVRRPHDRRRRRWTGTISESGKYLVTNVPEPADVSYNAGNISLFGSLQTEMLHFKKMTVKKGGKVYSVLRVDRLPEEARGRSR